MAVQAGGEAGAESRTAVVPEMATEMEQITVTENQHGSFQGEKRLITIVGSSMASESQGFTKAQAQLVKDSWELFKKDSAGNGLIFFSKIFELEPDMRELFPFTQDPTLPLEKNYKLKAHALLLFKLTGDAGVALGEKGTMQQLHPKVMDLGKKHVSFGVILDHFIILSSLSRESVQIVDIKTRICLICCIFLKYIESIELGGSDASHVTPVHDEARSSKVVKTALLHTINEAVSKYWSSEQTGEAVNAWSLAYDELVCVMQAEMDATRRAAAAAWASDD